MISCSLDSVFERKGCVSCDPSISINLFSEVLVLLFSLSFLVVFIFSRTILNLPFSK